MLIALAGRAGSGKNAVAKLLAERYHVREFSFAGPLKEFCARVFGFTHEQLYGPSAARNATDKRYRRAADCPQCFGGQWDCENNEMCKECDGDGRPYLTPRHALQTLGTEWGRACYENVWADLGVREAREWIDEAFANAHPLDEAPLAVITDCRFVNEARAVRAAGGEVWRVVRPGAGLSGSAGAHPSEAEQETPEFLALVTRTIENSGTLEDLRKLVRS